MTIDTGNGDSWSYQWDLADRLTGASHTGTGSTSYSYSPRGLRVTKTGTDGSTVFIYDQWGNVLYERTGSEYRDYIRAFGSSLVRIDGTIDGGDVHTETSQYYYHTDHLGTVEAVTDASGTKVWSANYSAFGELLGTTGSLDQEAVYTGKGYDDEVGLYYFNARWYDPELGRFISEDPAQDGVNWYVYVSNNPLKYVDPTGLFDLWVGGEVDLVGVSGIELGGGIVVDTDNPGESGFTGTAGFAGGANVGAGVGGGFAIRELEGDSFNIDANLGDVSVTLSFDGQGFNGLAFSVGPGVGVSTSVTKTGTISIQKVKDFFTGIFKGEDEVKDGSPESFWDKITDFFSRETTPNENAENGDSSTEIGDSDSGDPDDDSSSDDDKVICAELHRQGLMSDEIYRADENFGLYLREKHPLVLAGYQFWARPVVKFMQRSQNVTMLAKKIADPWTQQMAYRMGVISHGSFIGMLMMKVGFVFCGIIGVVVYFWWMFLVLLLGVKSVNIITKRNASGLRKVAK